jgi:GAF domain-containing protein
VSATSLPPHSDSWTERDRVAALRAYGVLHTAPEMAFDDIVALVARICEAPTALISLVDTDVQWFKARVGLDATETGRDVSFCDHAMREHEVMVVPDATKDPRFAEQCPGDRGAGHPLLCRGPAGDCGRVPDRVAVRHRLPAAA